MPAPLPRRSLLSALGLGALGTAWWGRRPDTAEAAERFAVTKPDTVWRKELGAEAYAVLRRESTERPGSSPLNKEHRAGTFRCKGCGNALFASRTKFESGTGWPSFYAALPGAVGIKTDRALFMERTEVHCARCGGHLGHMFDDGPRPTGKRYCINGVAMTFRPA
jgi:peptide-methionine (R)-S-oxide reductase